MTNTPSIEVWPGDLLRARNNHHARVLSRARYVLRRKHDGRYLAAALPEGLVSLMPCLMREPGIRAALDALTKLDDSSRAAIARAKTLPIDDLHRRLGAIGLDAKTYKERTGLTLIAEPRSLQYAGLDRYRRTLWLHSAAARAWLHMQASALREQVVLEAISGYRSHDYQLGIFERKRARGVPLEGILAVNAAPGYSEHHSGRALDISTPGEPSAEESFEATPAFSWLSKNAQDFGFKMSYPRNNPHGIVYEPWHWMLRSD